MGHDKTAEEAFKDGLIERMGTMMAKKGKEVEDIAQRGASKIEEIILLYKETEYYNVVPEGEPEEDITPFMERKFQELRQILSEIPTHGRREKLLGWIHRVVDELEGYVTSYSGFEGIPDRWVEREPRLYFFATIFDLMDESPEGFTGSVEEDSEMEEVALKRAEFFRLHGVTLGEEDSYIGQDALFHKLILATVLGYYEKAIRGILGYRITFSSMEEG